MDKNEILLITAPTRCTLMNLFSKTAVFQPPLDPIPLQIATILQRKFAVTFLPLYNIFSPFYPKEDWPKIRELVDPIAAKVVVFASDYHIADRSTSAYPVVLELSRYLKAKNPGVKIILSGRCATALGKKILLNEAAIDAVIIGECEEVIISVVDELLNGVKVTVPGVAYRYQDQVYENDGYNFVEDLDILPSPNYELLKEYLPVLFRETHSISKRVLLSVRTSRGCVYRCAFCGGVPYWNKYRKRSAHLVDQDIQACIDVLGDQARIRFIDDELFTFDRQHVAAIRDVCVKWNIRLRMVLTIAKFFDAEIAEMLKDFVETVSFGVENIEDKIVAMMQKPQTFQEVMQVTGIARNAGLSVNLFWVTGLPGETPKTMFHNLEMMQRLLLEDRVDSITTSILNPHPGTELATNPEKYGIRILNNDLGNFNEEGSYPVYELPDLNREQLFTYFLLSQLITQNASQVQGLLKNLPIKPEFLAGDMELFNSFVLAAMASK